MTNSHLRKSVLRNLCGSEGKLQLIKSFLLPHLVHRKKKLESVCVDTKLYLSEKIAILLNEKSLKIKIGGKHLRVCS
jgi:hypothetical protein